MKLIPFLLLPILSLKVVGQFYYPMPTDSAAWTVVEYGYQSNPPVTLKGTWHYGLSGDTVIDGKNYSKLYVNAGALGTTNPESCFNRQTAQYIASIREDSTKKIWLRSVNDTVDILTYDFSLNQGDTFCFNSQPSGNLCHAVFKVDSILIDGKYRRQIHFQDNYGAEEWIEGIGSTSGLFGYWSLIGNIEWTLQCYSENHSLLYGDSSSCSCIGTGISPPFQPAEISIYPNPATTTFNIETRNLNGRKLVDIYSLSGQKVKSLEMENDVLTIDVRNLAGAGFFLVIRNTEGKQLMKKLIKYAP